METNLPAEGKECDPPIGHTLVARTDSAGIITFANDALIETSGYPREELLGMHFNALCHPDMPPALLEGMMSLPARGFLWNGTIKNRCKDGGCFWADTRVAPVRKNGATQGYMLVSHNLGDKLTHGDVAKIEAANRKAAQGGDGLKQLLSVKNGVLMGIIFVTLMMIAGGILGISGLRHSSDAIRTLNLEEMEPVRTIGRITFLMADNRAHVALALYERPTFQYPGKKDHSLALHLASMEKNIQEIDGLLENYSRLPHDGAKRLLSDEYRQARARYVAEGLKPAKAALERGDYLEAQSLLLNNINPLYDDANQKVEILLKHLTARAEQNAHNVVERNEKIAIIAVVGVSFGLFVVMLSGLFFFRGTVAPLEGAIKALERIAAGNLSGHTDTTGCGEPGRVMAAVAVMQINLKVMMDEIRQSSNSIHKQCRNLNHTMMNLAQQSEEQHDRVYQTLDSFTRSCEEFGKLADNAEAVIYVAENSEKTVATLLSKNALAASPDGNRSAGTPAESHSASTLADPDAVIEDSRRLTKMIHELAAASRLEAFSIEDSTAQMKQVASLIVENRGDVQEAWAASQQMNKTANELDRLVKYFE